jgi:hypothetical protein
MPAPGKEIERPVITEQAPSGVEAVGYVEKVEKQAETQQKVSVPSQQNVSNQKQPSDDMGKIVSAQFAVQGQNKIVLPMGQEDVSEGLRHTVKDSVRWLSEWCVMMIKKYPGRVFYLPPENAQ